jgi:hypothetical protein
MPDSLSGVQRQRLLTDAIQQGHVHRVIGFFRGYQESGGHGADDSYTRAHRARARRSASGQPTYSRDQIAALYEKRRKGLFDEQQWARLENEIIAAGREGRIAGALDLNGK